MTFLVNNPEEFPLEALRGFVAAFSDYVQPVHGGVVRTAASPAGEVSVVIGGGSGHYPAFPGWVGAGMAHGAVCGNIFASPSASQVYSVAKAADNGGGILVMFGNYAGDVLHFGNGVEQLRASGYDVRIVKISDDIASNTPDKHDDRRGIAGDLFVIKVAGAAAAEGRNLDEVEAVARRANSATRTLGVAFTGCTLPGAREPLFTVEPGTFGLGLGIHGEQGISTHEMLPAKEIAKLLVEKVLEEEPKCGENGYNGRAAVLLNGLGGSKWEELFVLYSSVDELLKERGIEIVQPVVDEQVTSLDMAGVSLSLMFLDEDLERLWCTGANTPAFRRGAVRGDSEQNSRKRIVEQEKKDEIRPGSPDSLRQAHEIAKMLSLAEQTMREAEPYLGKIDAIAGDGDHGQGMVLGSTAAAKSAWESVKAGAGARTVLARAGAAWSEGAGGTSGALWGGALSKMAAGLSDDDAVDTDALVRAVIEGARSIVTMGGAQVGDKTMVDAVVPFADSLEVGLESGIPIVENWMRAAKYARKAAEKTAEITARKGRARTHGDASLGTPDPGAISFSLLMEKIGEALGRCGSDTSL